MAYIEENCFKKKLLYKIRCGVSRKNVNEAVIKYSYSVLFMKAYWWIFFLTVTQKLLCFSFANAFYCPMDTVNFTITVEPLFAWGIISLEPKLVVLL